MGKYRHWILKWHNLRTRQDFFMKSKKYRNLLKFLTLFDTYFVQNLTWYSKVFWNFGILYRFLDLISKNCDFSSKFYFILIKNMKIKQLQPITWYFDKNLEPAREKIPKTSQKMGIWTTLGNLHFFLTRISKMVYCS